MLRLCQMNEGKSGKREARKQRKKILLGAEGRGKGKIVAFASACIEKFNGW